MKKKKKVGLSLNKKKISELSSSIQEQLNGGGDYISEVQRCPTGSTCNCDTLCVYSCSC